MVELAGRHVLVLVQNLPLPFDRRVWQECRSLVASGARVTAICPADSRHEAGEFEIEGVRVVRYREVPEASGPIGYAREYFLALSRMASAVRSECGRTEFDVVHFCNPPDLLFLVARIARRRTKAAMIFDQHDLGPELVEAKHLPLQFIFTAVAKAFERLTYRSADVVISTNESYREIAVGRGKKSPDDVFVVRSGPYRSWAEGTVASLTSRNGRTFQIGYLGVIGRQEGIDYLLDALHELVVVENLDVQLCLVGNGPDLERIRERARELNLSDHITFFGRLPDGEMREVLMASDVCVNPDEFNEMNNLSTMNKIIEYMALGRPIVQFNMLEGRRSALDASRYAEPNSSSSLASAIREVLLDRDLAEEMSQYGRRRFDESLSWEQQIPVLGSAYRRALKIRESRERS